MRSEVMALQNKHELKTVGLCLLLLFVMSAVRQLWLHAGGMQLSPAQAVAVFFVYLLLLQIWWNAIRGRVVQKSVRRLLIVCHWLIVGWFVVRLLQNGLTAGAEQYGRFSGYLLVIPVVYGFLMHFYASLLLGKADDAMLDRRWYLLLIPASLIVLGFLTNDLHGFFHGELPVVSGPSNLYVTRPGFVLTGVWLVVMELAKIVNIFRSGRRIESRLYRCLPILELAILAVYSLPYILTAFAPPDFELIEFTAGLFLYEILVWETCILIGVLSVNTDYRAIFHHADIGLQILHPDGSVYLRSGGADAIQPALFAQLKVCGAVPLADGRTLHMASIADGYAVWTSDTNVLQRLTEELQEKKEALENEDILLRTELMQRRERRRLRERQRIYQMVYERTESERQAILALIPRMRAELERMGDEHDAERAVRALLSQGCDAALAIKNTGNRLLAHEYEGEDAYEA